MPDGYLVNPIIFLIDVLFGFYMAIVALRIIMQWAQWEYHNPLVQMIIKATQPPVKFLRRFIPAWRKWDLATVVLLLALACLKVWLTSLFISPALNPVQVVFQLFITIFTASIVIQVILSWVQANNYNPATPLINRMTSPLLRPIRKVLPDMGGFDLSPLIAIVGLQLVMMLVLPLLSLKVL